MVAHNSCAFNLEADCQPRWNSMTPVATEPTAISPLTVDCHHDG
jgi:hypothetical protein